MTTKVLIKSGTATPEDLKLFKEMRELLSVKQQIDLAKRMNLEYIVPAGYVESDAVAVTVPVPTSYTFDVVMDSVTVEAMSLEEARLLALAKLGEVVFTADNLDLTDNDDDEDCDDDSDESEYDV